MFIYVACECSMIVIYVEWERLYKPSTSEVLYPVPKTHLPYLYYSYIWDVSLCITVAYSLAISHSEGTDDE